MAKADAGALAARWIRPEVAALTAYHVPPADGLIKLDAMENPYPLPADLVDLWLERLRGVALNRYPDPGASALKARLREVMGLPADQGLVLGNGSDELIQMLALAVAGPGRVVLAPEPGFVMYRMIARFTGMDYVGVPLREDFDLDAEAMLAAIERHRPALVFLAYPNNPTGNLFDEAAMERIIEAAPGLVVVDEAYTAFAEASFLDRLGAHPNLLLMRTLSKLGLAGLRLGLLAGPTPWLDEIDKVRLPYNVNSLTQASAEFALDHYRVFEEQTRRIRLERERLASELAALPGLTVFPSRANFLLVRLRDPDALFDHLLARGILVKKLHGSHPALAGCLRFTVGSEEENARLLAAVAEFLHARA